MPQYVLSQRTPETSSPHIVPNACIRPYERQVGETEDSFRKECLESDFCGYLSCLFFTVSMGGRAEAGVELADEALEEIV